MNRSRPPAAVNRRGFLARAARRLGWVGLAGLVTARSRAGAPPTGGEPALRYNLDRFTKTDPKYLRFEEVGRVPSPRASLRRVTVGPSGHWYLAAGNHVCQLHPRTGPGWEVTLASTVRCVSTGPEGDLLVGVRDHLEAFDARGQRRSTWAAPGPKAWLTGVCATARDVFVADAASRVVLHYDRGGTLLGRIGTRGAGRTGGVFVVPSPYFDVHAGPGEELWVANPGRHRLESFGLEGTPKTSWGVASFDLAGFCGCCNPAHFVRLRDGRFITSEKGIPRIKVYSATGEFEGVVAGPEAFPEYLDNLNRGPVGLDVAVDEAGQVLVADTLAGAVRIFRERPSA